MYEDENIEKDSIVVIKNKSGQTILSWVYERWFLCWEEWFSEYSDGK